MLILVFGYLTGCAILIIAGMVVARNIFGMKTIIRQLKAQTDLLFLIAEKNGVDSEKINCIQAQAEGKVYISSEPENLPKRED